MPALRLSAEPTADEWEEHKPSNARYDGGDDDDDGDGDGAGEAQVPPRRHAPSWLHDLAHVASHRQIGEQAQRTHRHDVVYGVLRLALAHVFLAHAAAHQRSSSSGAWGSPRLIAAHVQRATHRHAARPLVAPV